MSPLIDVTNVVTQDDSNNKSEIIDYPKSNKLNNNHSILNYSQNQKEIKEVNINKISSVSTQCRCSGAKPKIFYKNGKGRSKKRISENSEGEGASSTSVHQTKNDRVPPVEYNNIFHSLERLSINSDIEVKSASDADCKSLCKPDSKLCFIGSSNHKEPQSESFSSSYQCIACGLEMSSLEILTNHLVKHIYEGLHAASWLNHTMSILLANNNSSSNTLPIQNVPTQTESREQPSHLNVKNGNNDNLTANLNAES